MAASDLGEYYFDSSSSSVLFCLPRYNDNRVILPFFSSEASQRHNSLRIKASSSDESPAPIDTDELFNDLKGKVIPASVVSEMNHSHN